MVDRKWTQILTNEFQANTKQGMNKKKVSPEYSPARLLADGDT